MRESTVRKLFATILVIVMGSLGWVVIARTFPTSMSEETRGTLRLLAVLVIITAAAMVWLWKKGE